MLKLTSLFFKKNDKQPQSLVFYRREPFQAGSTQLFQPHSVLHITAFIILHGFCTCRSQDSQHCLFKAVLPPSFLPKASWIQPSDFAPTALQQASLFNDTFLADFTAITKRGMLIPLTSAFICFLWILGCCQTLLNACRDLYINQNKQSKAK